MRDWDAAFNNMAHVEGSAALPAMWAARAAEYRATVRTEEDIPYGDDPRERFDLVLPDGPPKGLAMFVHGGYWMRLDKSYWTDLAEGARAQGWAVCLPSYTLAPEARIGSMTHQIAAAITAAASRIKGPIRLSGHSAGGHLVCRMICDDSPLNAATQARITHTLSISGLHDLRPLLHTQMNETLNLDPTEAARESAALHLPQDTPVTAWVGGEELPEFIRQAQLLALMWEGLGAQTTCHIDGTHNHFSVIEGLKHADGPITDTFIGTQEIAP